MRSINRLLTIPLLLGSVVLATVVATNVSAIRPQAAAPTAVAVVQVGVLLESLEQRASDAEYLEGLQQSLVADAGRLKSDIEQMEENLKNAVDPGQQQILRDEIDLARFRARAWEGQALAKLDIEAALRLSRLYTQIKTGAAQLAEASGYQLILVDDSNRQIQTDVSSGIPRQQQVLQQIRTRRILHADPVIDITDDLIVRMNNAFRAGLQNQP